MTETENEIKELVSARGRVKASLTRPKTSRHSSSEATHA
jgi:hypothetical protein